MRVPDFAAFHPGYERGPGGISWMDFFTRLDVGLNERGSLLEMLWRCF